MKKLSFKWKLFLILSYLQLIVFITLFLRIIYLIFTRGMPEFDYLIFIFLFAISIIILNSLLVINTIHRYFPDIPVPKKHRVLMRVTGILCVIIRAVMVFLVILALQSVKTATGPSRDNTATVLAIIILADCLLWLYPLILQLELNVVLKKNNAKKIQDMISSIGKEE